MAGESVFFASSSNNHFPKPFFEVSGRPMIEVVLENLMQIKASRRFVFVVNEIHVKKYHLDNVLNMITNHECDIVIQKSPTKGAVCSLLLAVKYLNHEHPILISNADQVINHDINRIVDFFMAKDLDGGTVCFDSMHPQWSYARVIGRDQLIETQEKLPISRNAIAGLYFFKKGREFVECAMDSIIKDRNHEGSYYTSSVLNEMVLRNKFLRVYRLNNNEYHSFYSPEKINDYENFLKKVAS